MNRLSGSMMNSATKVARFSRKNDSQMPNRWSTPVSMTLISRPECWALWKENGSTSTCSKIVRHGAEPPAMGHAVGLQRDDDVGDDAADADGRPQHEELASRRATGPRPACSLAELSRSTTLPNSTGS